MSCFCWNILAGCQNQPKTAPVIAVKPDTDIVMMPGIGGKHHGWSALGVKPMTLDELTRYGKQMVNMNRESAFFKLSDKKLSEHKAELGRQIQALDVERSKVDVTHCFLRPTA